jgi:hypothetical protein
MNTFHSFEEMAQANAAPDSLPVLEAFSGPAIVRWYNTMKYKLRDMIRKQEANRNDEYADLLRTYSNTWEAHPISGSMNREVLELLKAAAEPYAKMDWNQQSFFIGLGTSLDELIADQEALPTGVDTEQNMPMAGGAGGSMPPLNPDFGPEEAPPPGMGGEGEPGAPGAEGGAPGGEVPVEPGAPGAMPPGGEAGPGQPGAVPQPGQGGAPLPLPNQPRRPRPRI